MEQVNLQEIYETFSQGNEKIKEECVEKIATFIYFNYKAFFKADEDLASDVFLAILPKLRKIIDNYNPKLSHIYTYLKRYMIATFSICKNKQVYKTSLAYLVEEHETINTQQQIEENIHNGYIVAEPYAEYSSKNIHKINKFLNKYRKKNTNKQYFESILICKAALDLDDYQIFTLCRIFKLNITEIMNAVQYIRDNMTSTRNHISKYNEMCTKNFYKKQLASDLLSQLPKGSYAYNKYSIRQKNAEKFWKNNLTKLKSIKRAPSNKLVGEALNIDRGTVARNLEKIK